MFYPFMSDIVGNTICADLLDYLPRDRMNLGMEWRNHARLLRYFTIRPGSLFGMAFSIKVTILTKPRLIKARHIGIQQFAVKN
jgi:HD superfamily phosphohydrolase